MAYSIRSWVLALTAGLLIANGPSAVAQTTASPETKAKNWSPPAHKIYAQALSDATMAAHPELLSVTFHGVPPGMAKTYTMFAGSYPERIGNPDDPDDVDVVVKGITIIDPRWRRTDQVKKFVVQTPLRTAAGENIGLIVFAFRSAANDTTTEGAYYAAAAGMRDALAARIASSAALFAPATP
jgi:hypothetical protein